MDFFCSYNLDMDITQIIASNLSAWMDEYPSLNTLQKLAKASHVGFGTIRRAKNGDGNITVQNLQAIAQAFKRQAIDLLQPTLSKNPPESITQNSANSYLNLTPNEQDLLMGYREASAEVQQIMLNAAVNAISNQKKHKSNSRQNPNSV